MMILMMIPSSPCWLLLLLLPVFEKHNNEPLSETLVNSDSSSKETVISSSWIFAVLMVVTK